MKKRTLHDIETTLRLGLRGSLIQSHIHLEELCILVKAQDIVSVLSFLRDQSTMGFRQLIDICGVDYPGRPERFEVVYHLLSHRHNKRIRVKIYIGEDESVPSVYSVFKAANWFERETWDLLGIPFEGHPDLRRILTDYGFEGHPLRKDFPVTGFSEVRYDTQLGRVVYGPVNLPQAYRSFDFLSPWDGMTPAAPVLPGDEKATREL